MVVDPALSEVRATRYKAKVESVSPKANRTAFEDADECFLGVSLENDSFDVPKLEGIVEWISRRFRRCTVLVGDSIHRLTLSATAALSPEPALARALELGREFIADRQPVFDLFSDRTDFTVVTCAEVRWWADHDGFHRRLRSQFAEDPVFRASVESFGRRYHSRGATDLDGQELAKRVAISSEYFLEEFAVFCCLRARGLSVMVYPGSFSSLAEVAEGAHPDAPRELRDLTVVSLQLKGR
ncbi:hypothetical protein UO65_0046 [Actinokineospora spheciospongiae]|uniref:Cyclodipeptide synthase n=2 Tax=Actinokineospora spheciospongiae TaxID=909613 RepID=W7JEN8_9PSEU|nr:hypothetical protein UO65_0046 [Actinokineospora spheciospongiae]PWW60237.1 tRNA-dependent cyclodipeptide synthase [Actinokineospora spheciospongiae]